ncbi:hypothetical protein [Streptosporangium sp. NPDC002721]|uniref:hypothetical protein n=1 Tax=Streptosporangium sp. NPDC002721 TaxID=3366188 RepID=UPI0036B8BB24
MKVPLDVLEVLADPRLVDCVKLDERRASVLGERCGARLVHRGDFLTCVKPPDYAQGFQRVLMNPPFRSAALPREPLTRFPR